MENERDNETDIALLYKRYLQNATLILLADDLRHNIQLNGDNIYRISYNIILNCIRTINADYTPYNLITPIRPIRKTPATIEEILQILSASYIDEPYNNLNMIEPLLLILENPREIDIELDIANLFTEEEKDIAIRVLSSIVDNKHLTMRDILDIKDITELKQTIKY